MIFKGKFFLFGTIIAGFLIVGSSNINAADTNNSDREVALKIIKTVAKSEKINQTRNEEKVKWRTKKKIQKKKGYSHSQAKTPGNYDSYEDLSGNFILSDYLNKADTNKRSTAECLAVFPWGGKVDHQSNHIIEIKNGSSALVADSMLYEYIYNGAMSN